MDFDRKHYDIEGPLGIPMKDAQAQLLDNVLKALPSEDRQLVRLVTAKAPTEVMDGERADVSWVTTQKQGHENQTSRPWRCAQSLNDSNAPGAGSNDQAHLSEAACKCSVLGKPVAAAKRTSDRRCSAAGSRGMSLISGEAVIAWPICCSALVGPTWSSIRLPTPLFPTCPSSPSSH